MGIKHLKSNTLEYYIWNQMKQRCYNKNHAYYSYYGGRGIKVCERWFEFQNFLDDMGQKPNKEYSLERKDVNGDYTPSNCKWATPLEQTRNRRINKNNNSGVTGVGWCKKTQKWQARIKNNYKLIHLGRYDKKEDAIKARKKAEQEYWEV